jgi:hypothetical protein
MGINCIIVHIFVHEKDFIALYFLYKQSWPFRGWKRISKTLFMLLWRLRWGNKLLSSGPSYFLVVVTSFFDADIIIRLWHNCSTLTSLFNSDGIVRLWCHYSNMTSSFHSDVIWRSRGCHLASLHLPVNTTLLPGEWGESFIFYYVAK